MTKKTAISRASSLLRIFFIALWLTVIVSGIGAYLLYPNEFTALKIADFLLRFQGEIWIVYLAMSVLRGFTLLPSTPLIIAGTVLFPTQPFAVLTVSIIGILLSSSMIYFFSDILGFSDYFENHKPELTHRIKTRLEHPAGFAFVALWAFFPFAPTDLVCYVAGATRMSFPKFIGAVFAGEMILCIFYIFFGNYLLNLGR